MSQNEDSKIISGREFDTPLILEGGVSEEPERYLAEKPYELTKYEFSVLKKDFTSEMWFQLFAGATTGLFIAVLGKSISALLEEKNQNFEKWEIIAFVIGLILAVIFKFVKSKGDIEKSSLENVIEGHFKTNKPRRVHLTKGGERV